MPSKDNYHFKSVEPGKQDTVQVPQKMIEDCINKSRDFYMKEMEPDELAPQCMILITVTATEYDK